MRFLEKIGSVYFAVGITVSLMAVLVISTTLEALKGTAYAQDVFYQSRWFDIFLILLCLNLFASVLTRLPFKKYHAGFILTHIGIIGLLMGALASRAWGIEGKMTVFENEKARDIKVGGHQLNVISPDGKKTVYDLKSAQGPLMQWGALKFSVRFFEHALERPIEEGRPALSAIKVNKLKIFSAQNQELLAVDVHDFSSQEFPLGQTGWKISSLQYFPFAKVVDGKLANVPGSSFNPAVEFDLIDGQGQVEHFKRFALFPEFESMHGTAPAKGLFDGRIEFTAPAQDSLAEVKTEIIEDKNPGSLRPAALELKVKDGVNEQSQWIKEGEQFSVKVPPGKLLFSLEARQIELPFAVFLKDFRKKDYPGTKQPASFESDVALKDAKDKAELHRTISMNRPLDYKGFRIFQSSYIQDPYQGEASIFTVARNPGVTLIYFSSFIIFGGACCQFYVKSLSRAPKEEKDVLAKS